MDSTSPNSGPSPNPAPNSGPRPIIRRPAALKPYEPALGPFLKVLLYVTFASVAVLGATGAYLSAISLFDWWSKPQSYATTFTVWMFLGHGIIGAILFAPFFVFGTWHFLTAWRRPNKAAIRRGITAYVFGLLIGGTGFALFQFEGFPQLPTGTISRSVVYWLHIIIPFGAAWAYVSHRKAGPRINWGVAKWWGIGVTAFVGGMVVFHSQSPHRWYAEGPKDGEAYFHPSESRTSDGKFIPGESFMSDKYCMKCHETVYNDHFHSSHKLSSFNNPAYLASVIETRKMAMERDGNTKASRWCAGCHDPAPLFSGAFDDPNFNMTDHPTAHAGITCVACHSITHIHGATGNGGYTIEAPDHYPFAFNSNEWLRALSDQTVKAKPDVHKKTFLKPFHKSAEFCATCHKVALPVELNHYKDFLRGQNHYDSFLLSGASGHGARSFYYPPKAFENCSGCHMPLKEPVNISKDFGAQDFDNSGKRKVHSHLFPSANTGLMALLKNEPKYKYNAEGWDKTSAEHEAFLKNKVVRVDLFGLKEGATMAHEKLVAPLRPTLPVLKPGQTYIVDVVVRTLGIGHHFSQGTVDSNEIWVDFEASAGGKVFAKSGGLSGPNDTGTVDEWSHFINVHMLDRNGNRINRRNAQDIFTPLYDHQIPPGAAAVMHYRVDVPKDVSGPVDLKVRVRYRKFDYEFMSIVHQGKVVPKLPIVDMCQDKVTLPVQGIAAEVPAQESPIPAEKRWERWNDYGIANLIEGGVGNRRGNFRQAEAAFRQLLTLGAPDAVSQGHVNLARVMIEEGRNQEAAEQLNLAGKAEPAAPWWTRAWLTAVVNSETATKAEHLDAAVADLERIVDPANQPRERGFDFSYDYVIQNMLANRLFKRRLFEPDGSESQKQFVLKAINAAERVLKLEPEDMQAHDLLKQAYSVLTTIDTSSLSAERKAPDFGEILGLGGKLADAKQTVATRIELAHQIRAGLDAIGKQAPRADQPKIVTMRAIWKQLQPLYHAEQSPEVRDAMAAMMSSLHREFHAIFKPDEVARSAATRLYRSKHPAANYSARDRVVYPTTAEHRQTILAGGELLKD